LLGKTNASMAHGGWKRWTQARLDLKGEAGGGHCEKKSKIETKGLNQKNGLFKVNNAGPPGPAAIHGGAELHRTKQHLILTREEPKS